MFIKMQFINPQKSVRTTNLDIVSEGAAVLVICKNEIFLVTVVFESSSSQLEIRFGSGNREEA